MDILFNTCIEVIEKVKCKVFCFCLMTFLQGHLSRSSPMRHNWEVQNKLVEVVSAGSFFIRIAKPGTNDIFLKSNMF